jgi:hypothetical protein
MAKTLKSGVWSDPSIWDSIPNSSTLVEILHQVTLDKSVTINGMNVQGELSLDPTKFIGISSTRNIIVTGRLISRPSGDVDHYITFTGINENNFVGGGNTVLESDIGLWVMGQGALNLEGARRGTWEPKSDRIDEIIFLARSQTRNIIIGGTTSGQSHIFIKSTTPQNIRYVEFRNMGPRKDRNGDGVKELITGRYACHFHHSEDGSRGSLVEGCIARNCNSHCFVAHGSHGITMKQNMVFDSMETAFWYDLGHKTNDLRLENNLVSNITYVPRSLDQDSGDAPTFGAGGFLLGFGDGNVCNGNLVAYTSGDTRDGGAYIWPEVRNDNDVTAQLESPWEFKNNIAYRCPSGISVWQNNNHHHIVENFIGYYCDTSIFHGAYQNHYNYQGGYIKGGPIELRASSSTTNRVRFENMTIDANGGDYCVVANEGPLNGVLPILFRSCKFQNYAKKAIIDQNPGGGVKNIDVINCGLPVTEYQVSSLALNAETIRVQEGNKAWQVKKAGATVIPLFAPTSWGSGLGIKAEYFTPDFRTLLLSRIEPNVNIFDITHPQIHYAVPAKYAARWSGFITPQTTENYTFICSAGGAVRLWVNNVLIIDQWTERYPGDLISKPIALIVGVPYNIMLEYYNDDDRSQCLLDWSTGSIKREAIPMSQLYPSGVIEPSTTTTSTSSTTSSSTTRPTTSSTTSTSTTKAPVTTSTTTTTSTTIAGKTVIAVLYSDGSWKFI